MKTTILMAMVALLTGCGSTSWIEQATPTTDAERTAVAQHVEAVLKTPWVMSGDDQDWEDVVNATYAQARLSLCRKTFWEYRVAGMFSSEASGYTGQYRYADEAK